MATIRIYGEDSPLSGETRYESPFSGTSAYFDNFYGNGSGLTNVVISSLSGLTINGNLSVTGKTTTGQLQVTGGTLTSGYVLTSDGSGNAIWQAPTGGGGGTSSRTTGSTTTTNATITTLQTISGITDNSTSYIEVYVKAYQTSATNWGVWKRTLSVTKVSGTVTIQEENADVDKQSSGLRATSVSFSGSSGNVLVRVTGISATTINWNSAYEIIL